MTCPECGGELEIDRCCIIEERVARHAIIGREQSGQTHKRLAAAVLCTRCEYCAEMRDHEQYSLSPDRSKRRV